MTSQPTHQRIALGLRYEGSRYHGWQIQKDCISIQALVERALSAVADHPVTVICAGRTDAGVHATHQVIHFDTHAIRSEHAWQFGANANLPADISVVWVKPVPEHFHARYSATGRRYRYIFYNHGTRPGILRQAVGWWYRPLDVERMQAAAQFLLGEHDFTSFRGAKCQAHSPVRTLYQLDVRRVRDMVILEVHGNAFLLHMVRNIAGVLVVIGAGDQDIDWAKRVLEAKDRKQAGVTITPAGLYLVDVDYPPEFDLPRPPVGPFFI